MSAHRLATTINAHAWNADHSMLAVCTNTPELTIFTNTKSSDTASWVKKWVLKQHDFIISGIDWCAKTNKIVTVSHDRNAFVWNYVAATDTWSPQVVVLNIDRAGIDVKWSPDGSKFAVSSGSKVVKICNYDPTNDWWISSQSKKHKSTALSAAWHPSGQVLASVSTDYRCRVLSAYIDGVDNNAQIQDFGALPEVGGLITEFEVTRAWLNDCAWSPSGHQLAFVGHDSLIHFVTFSNEPVIQTIKCPTLPHTRILFLSETLLVAAGHGMNPELFARNSNGLWSFLCFVDNRNDEGHSKSVSGVQAARAMFTNKVTKGQVTGGGTDDIWTKHQNAITYMQPYAKNASGNITAFSTSGNDGRVVIWDLPTLKLPELNLSTHGL